MATARNGFVPAKFASRLDTEQYPVSCNANQRLFLGDAVSLINGSLTPVTAGQNPNIPVFGVVVGLYNNSKRPFTFNQPASGPFIVSGGGGFADVVYDVNAEFIVRCETSAAQTLIGENVQVTAFGGQALSGRSGMAVKVATSADNALHFKAVRLATTEELAAAGFGFGPGQGLIVRMNASTLKSGTANV